VVLNELKKPFWSVNLEEILKDFDVDPSRGLSEEEVQKRQQEFGPNVLFPPPESVTAEEAIKYFKILWIVGVVGDLLIFMAIFIPTAIFCGIVSILGDDGLTMTIVILTLIAILKLFQIIMLFKISPILKTWFEEKLKVEEPEKEKTTVLRDGKELKIINDDLVPGDIILFDTSVNVAYKEPYINKFQFFIEKGLPVPFIGEQLAADARLLESNNLELDEAILTGEAKSAKKDASIAVLPEGTNMSEAVNMVFAGSRIIASESPGTGRAVVVATGKNVEIGKISVPIPELDRRIDLGRTTPADKYRKPIRIMWWSIFIFFMIIMILSWISC
jgi:Ca2+-transporting ATPase